MKSELDAAMTNETNNGNSAEPPVIIPIDVIRLSAWIIISHPILLLPQLIGTIIAELLGVSTLYPDFSWLPQLSFDLDVFIGLGSLFVGYLIVILISGMYPLLIRDVFLKEKINLGRAVSTVFKRGLSLILASIVIVVIVAAGLFFLIIPGLIFYTWYFVTIPALILENRGPMEAMSASKEFARGRGLAIFAIIFIWILVNWFLTNTIDMFPFTLVVNLFLTTWVSVLASYLYLVYKT